MKNPATTIPNLQAEWHILNDLDRGRAVLAIHQHGTSIRELARELNCGNSLLRHLLLAIQAPAEDQRLAREGKISTNELVRRARAAAVRRTADQDQARKLKRTRASVNGSRNICDWMVQQKLSGAYCESILCEAQRLLANAEPTNRFPRGSAPADMPASEIIQRCQPPALNSDAIHELAWFAYWLALWTYYAFTDSNVRYQALELALNVQFKR